MRKRASGRISVTRPSNSKSSSFGTLRSFRLAGPTRCTLLAVAPRRGVAQEGDGFDAARACSRGLARLMTAALLMRIAIALVGVAIAAVPVPVLAMGRRPAGGVLCRHGLGVPRIGASVAQRYRHADEFFDVAQERHLFAVAQRDRDAGGAGARGTADAVHIGLRYVRQVVVYHMTDAVDVDAARGDVGG